MEDINEQEDADLDAISNDGDNLFEVIYRGGRLDNDYDDEIPRPLDVPDYNIPDDVNIRLRIHYSITEIDIYACLGCTTLTEVIFHENVTEIGRSAFQYCRNLQRIELPAGLLRVERDAFAGCHSLRGEIVIPASVQYIGGSALWGCTPLESVVFMPTTNVAELGEFLFSHCSNLRFVTLPQNLRLIPIGFFYNCTSLTRLRIPESVEQIEERAFYGSGLRSVTISENVHRIRRGAFRDCAFLERVTIHSTNLTLTLTRPTTHNNISTRHDMT